MASVNSMTAANTASGNPVNAPAQNPSARPSLRPSASTKVSDGGRRQSGSPVDGGQRRSNSQKAWSHGNPITQRSHTQQNGNMSQKQSPSPRPTARESNTPDNHAHDRLIFLFTSFIGLPATVTTKNSEKYTGIFSSSSLEANECLVILKMVQRPQKQDSNRANGVSEAASPFMGSAPDHTVSFDMRDVADIYVPGVTTTDVIAKGSNGATSGFKTDADISGNLAMRERTLKRWVPAADTDVDLSLEGTNASSGWDQFETNTRLFGATSSYDENMYTTRIDRSDPTYKQKEAAAARIAREIEGTDVDNAHVMEERGLSATADGGDEEDKYSGVRRDDEKNFPPLVSGQPNKYTPPARRQAAAQTVAPADPSVTAPPKESTKSPQVPPVASLPATTTVVDAEQTPAPAKTSPAPPAPTAPTTGPKRAAAENASANVETEVLDHFRQFANTEKIRIQERRRNQATHDRTVKLNELMKFSKNFKLSTPVPKDLVPILAKDPHRQETIMQKAQQHVEDKPPSKSPPSATAEQKPTARGPGPASYDRGTVPPATSNDRSNYPRGRQMYPPTGPHAGPAGRPPHQNMQPGGRQAPGMLGHRLTDNLLQRKGAATGTVPAPLPINEARIPPTGPAADQPSITSPSKTQPPPSATSTKFNVRAMEFKPNPAASTFTPGGAPSNPTTFARGGSVSRATSPSAFFGASKPRPIAERPSLKNQFNPIKRMKKENAEQTDKDYTFNGGIPPAYKTLPTWDVAPGNEEKTYLQMIKPPPVVPAISPQNRSASNPQAPHQQHMAYQFAQSAPGMPPAAGPPHGPHHLHPQQHHGSGPHFDDPHRMQMSASTSQVFPSPRMGHGYPSPMAPHAQLSFGQPMQQFYVNQGGPQNAHMRHYAGNPQFVNAQAMGAPMMVQQPSGGGYMGVPQAMPPYNPQMQMYSPNPGHVYPQHAPPQPHSGYPSPSRPAPIMMHQNSQPGQPSQVMFMPSGQHGQPVYPGQQPGHMPPARGNFQQQPHFQSSPHQAPHFPHHHQQQQQQQQQHRTPSSGYNQMPQMPSQGSSQPPAAAASGPQPSEGADEAK